MSSSVNGITFFDFAPFLFPQDSVAVRTTDIVLNEGDEYVIHHEPSAGTLGLELVHKGPVNVFQQDCPLAGFLSH